MNLNIDSCSHCWHQRSLSIHRFARKETTDGILLRQSTKGWVTTAARINHWATQSHLPSTLFFFPGDLCKGDVYKKCCIVWSTMSISLKLIFTRCIQSQFGKFISLHIWDPIHSKYMVDINVLFDEKLCENLLIGNNLLKTPVWRCVVIEAKLFLTIHRGEKKSLAQLFFFLNCFTIGLLFYVNKVRSGHLLKLQSYHQRTCFDFWGLLWISCSLSELKPWHVKIGDFAKCE